MFGWGEIVYFKYETLKWTKKKIFKKIIKHSPVKKEEEKIL